VQDSRRNPLEIAHPGRLFLAVAIGTLVLDQVSKAVVRASLVPGESITLVRGVLNLTFVNNVGAAFGLFPGRQPVFMATSLLVLFVIAAYWRRAHPREWPLVLALGLVCAGALGNLIDRAMLGKVTDFFEFGFVQFPVFNVADMAILTGVGILALWILFGPQPEVEAPAERPSDTPAADFPETRHLGSEDTPDAAQPGTSDTREAVR